MFTFLIALALGAGAHAEDFNLSVTVEAPRCIYEHDMLSSCDMVVRDQRNVAIPLDPFYTDESGAQISTGQYQSDALLADGQQVRTIIWLNETRRGADAQYEFQAQIQFGEKLSDGSLLLTTTAPTISQPLTLRMEVQVSQFMHYRPQVIVGPVQ